MTWMISFVKICQLIQSFKQDGASHFRLKGAEQNQKYVLPPIKLYTYCCKDLRPRNNIDAREHFMTGEILGYKISCIISVF
jgi:hypothetical protein